MAPSDMESMWLEASKRYAKKSGTRLEDIPKPRTTQDLTNQVERQNKQYEGFRDKSDVLFEVLAAAMKPIELVGNLAAGAASAVFPASGTVFGAAMYLINAAKGVSASLDAIAGLLDCSQRLHDSLEHLQQGSDVEGADRTADRNPCESCATPSFFLLTID